MPQDVKESTEIQSLVADISMRTVDTCIKLCEGVRHDADVMAEGDPSFARGWARACESLRETMKLLIDIIKKDPAGQGDVATEEPSAKLEESGPLELIVRCPRCPRCLTETRRVSATYYTDNRLRCPSCKNEWSA